MLAIKNAVLVMPDHNIPNATLLVEDGKIVNFGKKLPIPEDAEILDAQGNFVGPGLIDIHTHADGTAYFHDDPVILIADSFVADGPPLPGLEEAFDINFDWGGDIAGSKLTFDIACHNMMIHTGGSVCGVFKYASTNPAKLLSLSDRGTIAKGKRAALVLVDHQFDVKHVILGGEQIK